MYIDNVSIDYREKYINCLSGIMSTDLSRNSKFPALHYKVHENLFCNVFETENLSTQDLSVDAIDKDWGIQLKTFTENGFSCKISEHNAEKKFLKELTGLELALKLSELRNYRLMRDINNLSINNVIYHCVVRYENYFDIIEEIVELIDISNVKVLGKPDKASGLSFTDGKNNYNFNKSKSVISKRFGKTYLYRCNYRNEITSCLDCPKIMADKPIYKYGENDEK